MNSTTQQAAMQDEGAAGKSKEVIIVTGSSGLIGSRIIERLMKQYQLVGLDKKGNAYPPKEAENITFDITSPASIKAGMERVRYAYGNRIASVIHLAAYYDFSGKPSPLYDKVTVQGTENFLEALQEFDVEQFIFSSTNLIYKPTTPGQKINEECPIAPNWDYPESKADTEEVIHKKRGGMHAVILRLAGVYDDEGHSIPISHQIQRIYEKQFTSHFYSGDTSHGNVFLHMDDLIEALALTVEKRKELPEEVTINIGEPETPSYETLQQRIGKLIHGEDWETYEVPESLAKVGSWGMNIFGDSFIKPWMIDRADDHYELDVSRARDMLRWEPQHRLLDTLPVMIEKLKADPKAWYKENKLEMPPGLEKNESKKESREGHPV